MTDTNDQDEFEQEKYNLQDQIETDMNDERKSPLFKEEQPQIARNYSVQGEQEDVRLNARIKNKRKDKRPQSAIHPREHRDRESSPKRFDERGDKDKQLKRNLATYENWFGKNPISLKDLLMEACENQDKDLVIDTKKKVNLVKNENTKLKTLIKVLESDIYEKNRTVERLLNVDKFPFEEISDDMLYGFKKKIVSRFQGEEKKSRKESSKDPQRNVEMAQKETKESKEAKDQADEKRQALFNKQINNLTVQPLRECLKTVAISKYKQQIRELKRKIELCVFENEKLTSLYNDILTKDINSENRKLRQNLQEMTQMYNNLKDEYNQTVSSEPRPAKKDSRPGSAKNKKPKTKEETPKHNESILQDFEKVQSENRDIKENFNRLSLENKSKTDKLESLERQLDDLKKRSNESMKESMKSESEFKKLTADYEWVKNQSQTYESKLKEAEDTLYTLQSQMDSQIEKIEAANEESEKLKISNNDLVDQMEQMKNQLDEVRQINSKQENDYKELEIAIKEKEGELGTVKNEYENLRLDNISTIQTLEIRLKEAENSNHEFKNKLDESEQEVSQLNNLVSERDSSIKQLENQIASSTTGEEDMRFQLNDLKSKLKNVENERNDYSVKVHNLSTQLSNFEKYEKVISEYEGTSKGGPDDMYQTIFYTAQENYNKSIQTQIGTYLDYEERINSRNIQQSEQKRFFCKDDVQRMFEKSNLNMQICAELESLLTWHTSYLASSGNEPVATGSNVKQVLFKCQLASRQDSGVLVTEDNEKRLLTKLVALLHGNWDSIHTQVASSDAVDFSYLLEVLQSLNLQIDCQVWSQIKQLSYKNNLSQGKWDSDSVTIQFLGSLTDKDNIISTLCLGEQSLSEVIAESENDTFQQQQNKMNHLHEGKFDSSNQPDSSATPTDGASRPQQEHIDYIQEDLGELSSEKRRLDPHINEEEFELSQTYMGQTDKSNKHDSSKEFDDSTTPQGQPKDTPDADKLFTTVREEDELDISHRSNQIEKLTHNTAMPQVKHVPKEEEEDINERLLSNRSIIEGKSEYDQSHEEIDKAEGSGSGYMESKSLVTTAKIEGKGDQEDQGEMQGKEGNDELSQNLIFNNPIEDQKVEEDEIITKEQILNFSVKDLKEAKKRDSAFSIMDENGMNYLDYDTIFNQFLQVVHKDAFRKEEMVRSAIQFVFQDRKEPVESVQVDRSHFGFVCFFMNAQLETEWVFEEVDRNVDKNIDIWEFMRFKTKQDLQLANPFREYNKMDAEKDGQVKLEDFRRFYILYKIMHSSEPVEPMILHFVHQHVLASPEQDCDEVFKSMDLDGSKKISKFQFANWFSRKLTGVKGSHLTKMESAMRKIFSQFDTDKSNYVDRKEFSLLYTRIQSQLDAYQQFLYIDKDGSGKVDLKEFKAKANELYLPPGFTGNFENIFRKFDPKKKNTIELDVFAAIYSEEWDKHHMNTLEDDYRELYQQQEFHPTSDLQVDESRADSELNVSRENDISPHNSPSKSTAHFNEIVTEKFEQQQVVDDQEFEIDLGGGGQLPEEELNQEEDNQDECEKQEENIGKNDTQTSENLLKEMIQERDESSLSRGDEDLTDRRQDTNDNTGTDTLQRAELTTHTLPQDMMGEDTDRRLEGDGSLGDTKSEGNQQPRAESNDTENEPNSSYNNTGKTDLKPIVDQESEEEDGQYNKQPDVIQEETQEEENIPDIIEDEIKIDEKPLSFSPEFETEEIELDNNHNSGMKRDKGGLGLKKNDSNFTIESGQLGRMTGEENEQANDSHNEFDKDDFEKDAFNFEAESDTELKPKKKKPVEEDEQYDSDGFNFAD